MKKSDNKMVSGPSLDQQPRFTDSYFNLTRQILQHNQYCRVTYAVFMRRPVTLAPQLAIGWLQEMMQQRGAEIEVEQLHKEGAWVGAGEPLFYVTGMMSDLVDMETIFLQRLGACCIAAYNAYQICVELPDVAFLAMDARHCAGSDMAELMAYGASVGSRKAQSKVGAKGFVGCATDATAHLFGTEQGMGTMPHARIGFDRDTVTVAGIFAERFPDKPLTVLVDYFGA